LSSIFKQLLLRNCEINFVEICSVYVRKTIIKAAKRIFNSDRICRSYSDLNFGVIFVEHSVYAISGQPIDSNQIKSNLCAQKTSHLDIASSKYC